MHKILEYENSLNTLNNIFDNINEGVIITDENNKIIQVNKACENISGYSLDEVIGKSPIIFSIDTNNEIFYKKIKESINTNGSWIGELTHRHKDGTLYPINIKIFKLLKDNQTYFYAIFSNTSFHLSYQDALTNLPNGLKLKAQLEYVINNSKRNDLKFAVLSLDFDRFRTINALYGNDIGDELLISFATKFKNMIRSNDMVARVADDDFVIVLSDISNYLFVERVCSKILSLVSKDIKIKDVELSLQLNIGVSIYPENGRDENKLIYNSQSAISHSKQKGKNNFVFYSDEMNEKLLEFSQKEKDLLKAIKNDEFILHFQPEVDTSTNEIFSLEVLTRWNNKEKGLLLPGSFISDLESSNYIFEFEKLILEKACTQLKLWHDTGIYKGKISVNISGKHLEYGNLYDTVNDILVKTELNPKYLELEFLESDVMKISTKTLFTLDNLSYRGVNLIIDNFGRGFSSFNYLRECSISRLKIDKSYIDSLTDEKTDENIIKSIIDLGINMGISVSAEGIEISKQDEIIRKNSCSKVQGYFYAKPMDGESFEFWYKKFQNINCIL